MNDIENLPPNEVGWLLGNQNFYLEDLLQLHLTTETIQNSIHPLKCTQLR